MLVLTKCRLLCYPKAASRWLTQAARLACRVTYDSGERDELAYHAGLSASIGSEFPSIAVVRYPVTWYRSYWNHRVRRGWQPETHEIDQAQSGEFGQFMESAIEGYPGWLSNYARKWVGKPGDGVIVARYENVQEEVLSILKALGEPVDENKWNSHKPTNCGDYQAYPARVLERYRKRLDKTEAELIGRFYAR